MKKTSAESVLANAKWPDQFPFSENEFRRQDEREDAYFYAEPRIGVFHIDEFAVRALMAYYQRTLPPSADVLDLCSSWISHLPPNYSEKSLTILGMSKQELDANKRATARVVQDVNRNPILPFADASFDVVTNAVSVEYVDTCVGARGGARRGADAAAAAATSRGPSRCSARCGACYGPAGGPS
eukprot:IDg8524t1